MLSKWIPAMAILSIYWNGVTQNQCVLSVYRCKHIIVSGNWNDLSTFAFEIAKTLRLGKFIRKIANVNGLESFDELLDRPHFDENPRKKMFPGNVDHRIYARILHSVSEKHNMLESIKLQQIWGFYIGNETWCIWVDNIHLCNKALKFNETNYLLNVLLK